MSSVTHVVLTLSAAGVAEALDGKRLLHEISRMHTHRPATNLAAQACRDAFTESFERDDALWSDNASLRCRPIEDSTIRIALDQSPRVRVEDQKESCS